MARDLLTPGEILRGKKTLSRFNFFNVISFVLLSGNIITLYALRLGAGSFLVGLLASLGYVSYTAIFLGRRLAPRLGMVRLMGRFWLLRYILMVPIILTPLLLRGGMQVFALAVVVFSVLGFSVARGIAITGYNPIIGAFTGEKERGGFLARFQAVNHTVTLILGIIMALFLGRTAPLSVYVSFIAFGIVSGILATVLLLGLPETSDGWMGGGIESRNILKNIFGAPGRRAFRQFSAAHFLVSFATFMITPFLVLYFKQFYRQPDSYLVFYTVFGNLGGVLMALLSGFLIDRIGAKPLYFLFTAIIALSLVPMILSPTLPAASTALFAIFVFFFHYIGGFGIVTTGQAYFFNAVRTDELADLGSVYYLIEGLGSGLGALCGGILLRFLQTETALRQASVFRVYFLLLAPLFVGLLVLVSRMERLGAFTIRDTLGVILSPRDLRAISLLHRLRKTRTPSEEKRVIHALAASKSDISVGELLERLRSPRFSVRVETLSTLRALPPDEREIQPLITEVKNHAFTSAYIAAGIIGTKGYTQGIDVLRKRLHSNDYYLSGECMVALARLGDRGSIGRIEEILEGTDNPRLIIHAASALEKFGNVASIPVIVRKLLQRTSPFLRDEIILALSGILGMGSWFYPHYTIFLESATRGILSLQDDLDRLDDRESVESVAAMLKLLPGRDRERFARQAEDILRECRTEVQEFDVSEWFGEALRNERIARLDRFCYLVAAFVVWTTVFTTRS